MATLAELRTRYFYAWERRGRGWDFFDVPVGLEPSFVPFHPPSAANANVEDDGLHATTLHFLFRKLFPKQRPNPLVSLALEAPKEAKEASIAVFSISLPRTFDLDGCEAQQLLLMLSYCSHPVSFEVIGTSGTISLQIACAESEAAHVESQIKTYYPTCTVIRTEDVLKSLAAQSTEILEFGLVQEFMRPLESYDTKAPSMLLGLKGILDSLGQGEGACLQVMFQGTKYPWSPHILRSVSDGRGHSFFEDAPEMPKLAQRKTSSQLFGTVIRVMGSSTTSYQAKAILKNMGHAVMKQSASEYNSLMSLDKDGDDTDIHMMDFMSRRTRRYGMLLNVDELATFVHVPDDGVIVKALTASHVKTKALPPELKGHSHVLGMNSHQGVTIAATVSEAQRVTHSHVIGATGTGKSTYLLSSITQDIQNGNGLALIDPHGDLCQAVLNFIPEHRLSDVILVDPSDKEYSVGFNVLKANSELEKEVLSSDLISIFQRLSTSWGDQMTSVLANALLAFLESTDGGTLLDVRRFLLEPAFRASVLKTVSDSSVNYYWQQEFSILKTNSIGSILTRLDSFLRPKAIRHMVSQRDGLNFSDILKGRKILLVKLSHGLIGESNSYLFGSLFLSKIYQTALSRQNEAAADRKGFFVYVDEFQHYLVPSLSYLLSGSRKYSIGLTLAHQSLEQISNSHSELASSLIANAGIRMCFRLGENDAQKMEKGFASFDASDLMNLSTGQAICRVGRSDMDFNITVPKDIPTDNLSLVPAHEVVEASRKKYGALRSALEPIIQPRSEPQVQEPEDVHIKAPPIEKETATEEPPTDVVQSGIKIIEDPQLVQSMIKRKEESKHRYLQMLIKRNAESRGYKATLEQPTKDGKGRVDIVLQKDKLIYAVEVGVTTIKEWEVHNIEKCLADGYINVIAVSEDIKGVELMKQKLTDRGLLPGNAEFLKVHDITEFMGMLNATESTGSSGKTIKGYRVKVEYGKKDNK